MSRKSLRKRKTASESTLDSWLFKFGAKLLLSVLVAILALSLMQCTIKKPEAPTWNTQLTVPLVNRTYSMSEILDKIDQDGVGFDTDSNVIFSMSDEIDTVRLDADEMTTADLEYRAVQQLGLMDIPAPYVAPVTLSLTQIGGLATYLPGTVPPTNFTVAPNLPLISSLSSVSIYSGQAYIVIANSLGFAITVDSVEIWDLYYNRSLGYQNLLNTIPDGGVDSVFYDLTGQTMSNDLEVRVRASTPGGTVLSTSGKSITTTVRFQGDLTISSAVAQIPAMTRDFSEAISLGESDAIHSATLTSGTVVIDIANQTNLSANIEIRLPDLLQNGVPLTIQRLVDPISSRATTVDLAGYVLQPTDLSVPQDIRIEITASVIGTGSNQVMVDRSDQFVVDASLSNLSFSSITGLFSTVGTTLEPSYHDIDVPEGFDSIRLAAAVLTIEIDNGVSLPGYLTLTVLGNNGKTLTVTGAVSPGAADTSVVTAFIDSTVADFLSPLPSQITISGDASFGDGINVATIHAGDFVHARVEIVAPFELIIPETTIEPDVVKEHINQDDIGAITDHVVEARLIYNVINRLPLGARVNLYLSGDSATVVSNPQLAFINEIFVTAAPTTGSLANDTVSTGYQAIVIDSADIRVLENDTLYIASELILEDTNGQPVKLVASDYLTLIGRIEIDYRFDGEF